jgi:hypothetical protein
MAVQILNIALRFGPSFSGHIKRTFITHVPYSHADSHTHLSFFFSYRLAIHMLSWKPETFWTLVHMGMTSGPLEVEDWQTQPSLPPATCLGLPLQCDPLKHAKEKKPLMQFFAKPKQSHFDNVTNFLNDRPLMSFFMRGKNMSLFYH